MPEEALILKRNREAYYSESYNVLFEGRYVGRIYKSSNRSYLCRKAHRTRIDPRCVLLVPITQCTSANQRRAFYHALAGIKLLRRL